MGKVINMFSDEKDFDSCSYFDTEDRLLGVSMRDGSLAILPLSNDEIEVVVGDTTQLFKRAELAEFIHVAKILIDSENRHLHDFDYVGLNYGD